jgi:ATP-binding cassette subfamily B protein
VVVLDHGQIIEDGTHEDLITAGGRYAELLRLQAKRFQEAPS